jgi:hypothetical protein
MAIKNPKKQFNFRVSIPGSVNLPVFGIQEFTPPDYEINADEHGESNTIIGTAGIAKAGSATLERIMPTSASDAKLISNYFHLWAKEAQDPMTGLSQGEDTYKRTVIVTEFNGTGTPQNSFVMLGCFPIKVNGRNYKRGEGAGNLVENVELWVDVVTALEE